MAPRQSRCRSYSSFFSLLRWETTLDRFRYVTPGRNLWEGEREKKRENNSRLVSKERITGGANEEQCRASLVLTARIKTNAIWARIIRNCLLSRRNSRPRVIYRASMEETDASRPAFPSRSYFSSSNYTLLKRWKNLKSPLKRDRFSFLSLSPSAPVRSLYL